MRPSSAPLLTSGFPLWSAAAGLLSWAGWFPPSCWNPLVCCIRSAAHRRGYPYLPIFARAAELGSCTFPGQANPSRFIPAFPSLIARPRSKPIADCPLVSLIRLSAGRSYLFAFGTILSRARSACVLLSAVIHRRQRTSCLFASAPLLISSATHYSEVMKLALSPQVSLLSQLALFSIFDFPLIAPRCAAATVSSHPCWQ